jgi:hypothetical protein
MLEIPSFTSLQIPTDEEMYQSCRPRYEHVAPFMIDQWPQSVRDVSFKTELVPVDTQEARLLFDYQDPLWKETATRLATHLDTLMDWQMYFIRLNSRSPKDVIGIPITCSGRQAVDWIFRSMRCMDDVTVFHHAKAPMYIALRQPMAMHKDGEFRCFAVEGKMIAVSRYFYNDPVQFMPEPGVILEAADRFYKRHLQAFYPTVVFDLYAPGQAHEILIELNPYGLSDPCGFGSYEEVEKGGERLGVLQAT